MSRRPIIDAPEWNTDALGPTKRALAGGCYGGWRRCGAGGGAAYGRASNIPASNCRAGRCMRIGARTASRCGRTRPCWPRDEDTDTRPAADAARFAAALAERLQIDPALIIPAYEDIHYYLWREQRLPANVVVEDAKLRDPLERARLARVFEQGLARRLAACCRCGADRATASRRWQSGKWFFRGDTMFLLPGNSPIGLRLPLDKPALGRSRDDSRARLRAPTVCAARRRCRRIDGCAAVANGPLEAARASTEFRRCRRTADRRPRDPSMVRTALSVEAARRHAARLLAAAVRRRGLAGARGRDRGTARRSSAARWCWRAICRRDDPRLLNFSVTPDPG